MNFLTKLVLFLLIPLPLMADMLFMQVTDKAAADKIEASVKAEYPTKTFTVTEKTSVEVIK